MNINNSKDYAYQLVRDLDGSLDPKPIIKKLKEIRSKLQSDAHQILSIIDLVISQESPDVLPLKAIRQVLVECSSKNCQSYLDGVPIKYQNKLGNEDSLNWRYVPEVWDLPQSERAEMLAFNLGICRQWEWTPKPSITYGQSVWLGYMLELTQRPAKTRFHSRTKYLASLGIPRVDVSILVILFNQAQAFIRISLESCSEEEVKLIDNTLINVLPKDFRPRDKPTETLIFDMCSWLYLRAGDRVEQLLVMDNTNAIQYKKPLCDFIILAFNILGHIESIRSKSSSDGLNNTI